MSDVRSWDRWGSKSQTFTQPAQSPGFRTPVRVIEWPEGAPPQEEVPQAGQRVRLVCHYPHYYPNEGWVVINGIPERHHGSWGLQVVSESDPTEKAFFPVEIIQPVEPEEPQLYTEADIRKAARTFFTKYATVDQLVGNLKREAAK